MATETVALHETTRERYLNYALSVITSRALPDVRDGLKPVQRRILYAMFNDLKLSSETRFRKCAAVVGEVMGKYHPHGDQSIYDALVRLAQPWSMRYPLVDGQGNFGSLDGDDAAAMRYTEARLEGVSAELLRELKKETVDFRDNFEGTYREPVVLPAQIPHLLVNGAQGIAVGMATSIPPHNLGEVIDGLVALIEDPALSCAELMEHIPAPDFPTAGRITTPASELQKIYETGEGPIELRGELEVGRVEGGRAVVITSLPFNVNKSSLVESIAQHIIEGKVPQLVDVRDESTDSVRIICELKRGSDPGAAVAYLYKHTALRSRFHVNLTCLTPEAETGRLVPRRVDLKTALRSFLDFRFEVLTRRLEFDLRKLDERIHILEGFAIVFDALDEAIALIRGADDRQDAHHKLRVRFDLSDPQAEAILEIRLYRLSKMEIGSIVEELEEKQKQASRIRRLLRGRSPRWDLVRNELMELDRLYRDDRRTSLPNGGIKEASYSEEDYLLDEDARVIVTRDGWLKRQKSYTEIGAIRVREGDEVMWAFPARTKESAVFFSDRGRAYTARVSDLIQTPGYGEPIHRRFDLADKERIVGVAVTDRRGLPEITREEIEAARESDLPPPPYLVALTRGGSCLRTGLSAFAEPSNRKGRVFVRFDPSVPDDGVVRVMVSDESDEETIALATVWGRALVFYVDEINILKGPGRGVRAIKLNDFDRVLGFNLSTKARDGLEVQTARGRTEIVRTTKYQPTRRGGKGREILKRGKLVSCRFDPVEVRIDLTADEEMESGEGSGAKTVEQGDLGF
ncbi:MAG: DNA topoisomerase [Gemmatimonadetes bacterium]|nr:DNA topoisomerase [Gemmatimonadota bacterium]